MLSRASLSTSLALSLCLAACGKSPEPPKAVAKAPVTAAVAPAAKGTAPASARPSGLTKTAKAPVSSQASKEVGKLDAVRIGIRSVAQVTALDPAQFPLRVEFQDPRSLVQVPSPDHQRQVWRSKDKTGYYLFLAGADGRAPKRLSACKNGYQPVWSPDGKQILYSAMDWQMEERNLFIYDIAKGKSRRAFNAKKKVGGLAAWSPNGGKIVFTYFDDLWIMNANGIGRSLLNLSGRINKPVTEASLIAWSADGSRLAYRMRGDNIIYILELAPKI